MRRPLSPLTRAALVGLTIGSVGCLVAGVAYANYDTGMLGERVAISLVIVAVGIADAVMSGRFSKPLAKR